MHKQKTISFNVDEKIQPIIQYITDELPMLTTIASCQGGNGELNESEDSYILLIVRDINQLNKLIKICDEWQCQYIPPDNETGLVPTYRISIRNLDKALITIEDMKLL